MDTMRDQAEEYTRNSVLAGVPLKHLRSVVKEYREGIISLENLSGDAGTAFRLHEGVPEVKRRLDEVLGKEGSRDVDGSGAAGSETMDNEDYLPETWSRSDPQLSGKIDKFIALLEFSIKGD